MIYVGKNFPVMPFHLRDFDRGQREDLTQVWLYLSIKTLLFCQTDFSPFCQIDLPNFKLKFVLPNFGQTLRTSFLANFYLMPPQLCMGPDITRPESDPFSFGYPWKTVHLANCKLPNWHVFLTFLERAMVTLAWHDQIHLMSWYVRKGLAPRHVLAFLTIHRQPDPTTKGLAFNDLFKRVWHGKKLEMLSPLQIYIKE